MIKVNRALIKGSFILLVAFNIFNVLNFFFHFSMARMLSVADYGILATLFSIIYIFTIFSEAVQTVLTKYSAKTKDAGKVKNLLKRSLRKGLKLSFLLFFCYALISIPLFYALEINYLLLLLNGGVIFAAFIIPIYRGVMLGTGKFRPLGWNLIIESSTKLIFAILLVFFGFKVYGAIFAVLVGSFIAFLFCLKPLKEFLSAKEKYFDAKGIYSYGSPVLVVTAILTLFFSVDIIIAKVFFESEIVGHYAIASLIAKTIFWGTQPISRAMFSHSAQEEKDEKKSRNILMNAFALVSLCVLIALLIIWFYPELLVKIFSGKNLAESASIVIYNAIAMSLLSFTNLFLLYKLSKSNFKGYFYLPIFLLIEILLLSWFSENLLMFSKAFAASSLIFFLGVLIIFSRKK